MVYTVRGLLLPNKGLKMSGTVNLLASADAGKREFESVLVYGIWI